MNAFSPQWFLAKKTLRLRSKPMSRSTWPPTGGVRCCTSQTTSCRSMIVLSRAAMLGLPPKDAQPVPR